MKMLTVFFAIAVLLTLTSCGKQEVEVTRKVEVTREVEVTRIVKETVIGEEFVTAKVLGIHEFELRPGVDPEEYEEFVIEVINPLTRPEGLKVYILKGDRGEREGKYLAI